MEYEKKFIDGAGNELDEGSRVYCGAHCGTLRRNVDYPHISDWYVAYDDGNDFAVLFSNSIFKYRR